MSYIELFICNSIIVPYVLRATRDSVALEHKDTRTTGFAIGPHGIVLSGKQNHVWPSEFEVLFFLLAFMWTVLLF